MFHLTEENEKENLEQSFHKKNICIHTLFVHFCYWFVKTELDCLMLHNKKDANYFKSINGFIIC